MSSIRIPLLAPLLSGNEAAYLQECVDTNFVSSVGPFVGRFEEAFATWLGVRHAVAVSSGTAAIHLALAALGVTKGDEVWVSDLTFIASVNPIVYCGAVPVLVDSEAETRNLDPGLVVEELERRARIGARQPSAIVVVHLLGHPADIGPVLDVARRYGVPVVEDAAEAMGAGWVEGAVAGCEAGAVGTVGCFSFNGNKLVTTGGGGMVVTADDALAARVRHLSTQARVPGIGYRHDAVGFNYRLTNVAAALGLAQLERVDWLLERKRAVAERYDAVLQSLPGVAPTPRAPWARGSHWLYTARVKDPAMRDRLLAALVGAGIEARPIWSPVHVQGPYRSARLLGSGRVAEQLGAEGLSLPSSPSLSESEQRDVVEVLATSPSESAWTVRS